MEESELEKLIFGEQNSRFSDDVKSKLDPFVKVLNNYSKDSIYEYLLKYSDYHKAYYISVGTKYSSNDETTLLACFLKEETKSIEVTSPLLEDEDYINVLLNADDFTQKFASILRNLLREKTVQDRLQIYERLYQGDFFTMTVFLYERFRYIPENVRILCSKIDVGRLKKGEKINLPNDFLILLNNQCVYESEVNGIIAYVYLENEQWYACVKRPT